MKRFLLSVFVVSLCFALTSFKAGNNEGNATDTLEKINWVSMEEAIALNKTAPKKVFVDLYTDWCTWCKKMEYVTFAHPYIVSYINSNFYAVKLDAEQRESIAFKNNNYIFRPDQGKKGVHEMAIYLTRGRLGYPSVVFLDENMDNPQPVPGFQNPARMDMLMKYFGEGYNQKYDWGVFKQYYKSPLLNSPGN